MSNSLYSLLDATGSDYIDDNINTLTIGDVEHLLCPVGSLAIIYQMCGANLLSRCELFVRRRRRHDSSADRCCNLVLASAWDHNMFENLYLNCVAAHSSSALSQNGHSRFELDQSMH